MNLNLVELETRHQMKKKNGHQMKKKEININTRHRMKKKERSIETTSKKWIPDIE